ncbi:MAG: hypothetical protein ACI8S6_004794 [Myxococcota bacterium]|jgi:hypothetical protein
MQRLALFGGLALLTACGGPAADEDDDDFYSSDAGTGFNTGSEETGFQPSADAPFIIDAEVYCDYTEC